MAERSRLREWLPDGRLAAWLAGGVMLAYARMWWAGFIWGDDDSVTLNSRLRTLDGLWAIWFQPGSTARYEPLTQTSFWLEYQLWGLTAPCYHVVNVLLHAGNAVLLGVLLRRLAVPGAWLGAVLFALHPVQVETVAWITEMKNTLSAFFGLGFLLAWLRFRFGANVVETGQAFSAVPEPVPFRWLAIAVALFMASLLCQRSPITLIVVVLVISWWKAGRLSGRDLVGVAPLVCLGLPLTLATTLLQNEQFGAHGTEWILGVADRIVLAGQGIVFYAGKLIWPRPLLFFYPRWEPAASEGWQWLFPAAVAGALALLWAGRDRLGRGPLACALMFIGMLSPAIGFFAFSPYQDAFVADHFQYHASAAALAGMAAAATLAAANLSDPRLRVVLLGSWIGVLACMTAAQTSAYVGVEPLCLDVLAHDPTNCIAANKLGSFYARQNRLVEAKALLGTALQNARSDRYKSLASWNLCDLALRIPDDRLLLESAGAAHSIGPTEATRSMLALGLVRAGASQEAEKLLANSSGDQPDTQARGGIARDANRLARAEVAAVRGDLETAARHLDALFRDTGNDWMRLQAGVLCARIKLGDRAVKIFGELREHPVHGGSAYANLGLIALERGNAEVAEACFHSAAARDTTLVEPFVWLARIYARQGRFADAEVSLIEAVRRAPEDAELASSLEKVRADRASAASRRDP